MKASIKKGKSFISLFLKMKHLIFLHFLFFLFLMQNAHAQYENINWFFGEYSGISFEIGEPEVLTDGLLMSWEGCASISSSEGELLFYTEGINVYNMDHQIMPNGSGLNGDGSSSQSAVILQKPGSNTYYYIFTIDDVDANGGFNGLCFSGVDMLENNMLGVVVAEEKNMVLEKPMCEKLTAVKHSNGVDIWVLTQKWGTNDFYAYLITSYGVEEEPVISSGGVVIGGDGADIDIAKGYMKISPDGTKMARANAGLKSVELFKFNPATGKVTYRMILKNLPIEPYGIEFSPSSRFLYVNSWKTNPEELLFQYDLLAGNPIDIVNSQTEIASGMNGALQLAPDNKIYVANAQSLYIGRINQPNEPQGNCDFEYNAVYLEGKISMWGLPNFMVFGSDSIVGVAQWYDREELEFYFVQHGEINKVRVNIPSGSCNHFQLVIYDIAGHKLAEKELVKGRATKINSIGWQSGLYLAKVISNGKIAGETKFVVR